MFVYALDVRFGGQISGFVHDEMYNNPNLTVNNYLNLGVNIFELQSYRETRGKLDNGEKLNNIY